MDEFTIPPQRTLAEIEKVAIVQTLMRTNWNKQEAAQILGLYRPTLYSKMKKHQILDQRAKPRGVPPVPRPRRGPRSTDGVPAHDVTHAAVPLSARRLARPPPRAARPRANCGSRPSPPAARSRNCSSATTSPTRPRSPTTRCCRCFRSSCSSSRCSAASRPTTPPAPRCCRSSSATFPTRFDFLVQQLDAFRQHPVGLSVTGALGLVWGSLGVFGALTSAVNEAWGVSKPRGFWQHRLASFVMFAGGDRRDDRRAAARERQPRLRLDGHRRHVRQRVVDRRASGRWRCSTSRPSCSSSPSGWSTTSRPTSARGSATCGWAPSSPASCGAAGSSCSRG